MAAEWFTKALVKVMTGGIDLDTDTFKALLLKSGSTPDMDSWEFVSDAVAGSAECSGGTYARITLVAPAVTQSGNEARWGSNSPLVFNSPTPSQVVATVILFKDTGVDGTSPVVGKLDGGSAPNELPWVADSGQLQVIKPSDGWLKIVRS